MTWTQLNGTKLANAIDRINDLTVVGDQRWAVSAGGHLFRWSDGDAVVQSTLGGHARCIGFAQDGITGWVGFLLVGAGAVRLKKTIDGGRTWVEVPGLPSDPEEGLCGMCVLDATHAYACGTFKNKTHPGLLKTVDGNRWQPVVLPTSAFACLTDLRFWDVDHGILIGGAGKTRQPSIFLTSDGGCEWRAAKLPDDLPAGSICWKVFYRDRKHAFVSLSQLSQPPDGAPALVLKTIDGGDTWTTLRVAGQGTWDLQGVGFVNATHGWAGDRGNVSWQTTDAGKTWRKDAAVTNVNRLVLTDDTLFAAGDAIYVRAV